MGLWPLARRAAMAALAAAMCVLAASPEALHAANNSVQGAPKKEEGGYQTSVPQAILIDAESGSVLFEKNADQVAPPSSMQKLMTVEVVFDLIQQGKLKLTDEFRVSENAWRTGGAPSGGSTMFAAIHSMVPLDDLLHGAIIQSGNDSCIIMAEAIAGNERNFAQMMTRRARALGLNQANFGNSTGLPDPANLMSVRELALLARHIIFTYPASYKLFGEAEYTWNKIRQFNRNPILKSVNGADGLKTGFTKEGGYGVVASAIQNNTRLIAVVNGAETADQRADEGKKLLEWGFRNFENRTLFSAEQTLGYAKVFGGDQGSVGVRTGKPVSVMVQKNGNDKVIARVVYQGPLHVPVAKDRQVATLKVWRNNNLALEAPLYATESIGTGSLTRRAFDGLSEMMIGWVRTGLKQF